jgi:hypothetical protein
MSGVFVCNKSSITGIGESKTNNTLTLTPVYETNSCFFKFSSSAKMDNNQYIPREYIKGFGKYFESKGHLDNGRIIWDEKETVWDKFSLYIKQ